MRWSLRLAVSVQLDPFRSEKERVTECTAALALPKPSFLIVVLPVAIMMMVIAAVIVIVAAVAITIIVAVIAIRMIATIICTAMYTSVYAPIVSIVGVGLINGQ